MKTTTLRRVLSAVVGAIIGGFIGALTFLTVGVAPLLVIGGGAALGMIIGAAMGDRGIRGLLHAVRWT
jgi:hypothetical protein